MSSRSSLIFKPLDFRDAVMSPFLDCFEIFQLTVFPFDPPSLLAKRSFQENVKPFALWTDLSPSKFTIKHGSSFHKSSTPLQFEDQQNYGLIWIKIVHFIYHIPPDIFLLLKIEYQWGIRNSKTPSKTLPYFFHNHYIIFVPPFYLYRWHPFWSIISPYSILVIQVRTSKN